MVKRAGELVENIGIETEQIDYKKTTGELKEGIILQHLLSRTLQLRHLKVESKGYM